MSPVTSPSPFVTVRDDGATIVLEVGELLDGTAGAALLAAAEAAVTTDPQRIDIDLTGLRSWTQDGAASLVHCRTACADLPQGLHYRTGRGPGRAALLAAYT